jgi:hypothetical protein
VGEEVVDLMETITAREVVAMPHIIIKTAIIKMIGLTMDRVENRRGSTHSHLKCQFNSPRASSLKTLELRYKPARRLRLETSKTT